MRTYIYTSSLLAILFTVVGGCGDNPPPPPTPGELVIGLPAVAKTSEAGGSVTFTVALNRAPSQEVVVPVVSSNPNEGKTNVTSLTFTSANFSAPQQVRVVGIDDNAKDGDVAFNVALGPSTSGDRSFSGLEGTVALSNVDNEVAGFAVSAVSGSPTENGGSASFTVALTAPPTENVVLQLVSSDLTEATLSVAQLTFTPVNYAAPQQVRVVGVNDDLQDGPVGVQVRFSSVTSTDPNYAGAALPAPISLTNIDNDTAGVTTTEISEPTTEAGGQATFTIVLNTQPTANVTISVASTDATEGTAGVTEVAFTPANWNAPQTVTVTGVNDDAVDGNQVYSIAFATITSTDSAYAGLTVPPVAVTNIDDETAGFVISSASGDTNEAGQQAMFSVALTSQPQADVTLSFASSDATEGTLTTTSLTFTPANWNSAQQVIVTGANDDVADGNQVYQINFTAIASSDADYMALGLPAPVALTNIDDETAGLTIATINGSSSESGDSASFSVVLNSQPLADVVVNFASDDNGEGVPAVTSLTFTSANWNAPQTVTVNGVDDAVADGNQPYQIDFSATTSADPGYDALALSSVDLTNLDNDTAGILVSSVSGPTTEAGGLATFTIVLQSEPTADVTVNFNSDDLGEGTVAVMSLTFTPVNWNVAQTVTITGVDDALADGAQPYQIDFTATVSADPNYATIVPANVDVSNTDNDTAGIAVSAISGNTAEDGTQATFSVVLNSQPFDDVTVNFASDDLSEGISTVTSLVFTTANWNVAQAVTVVGQNDAVQDGNQPYQIDFSATTSSDATYAAITPASVNLVNQDDDVAGITIGVPSNGGVTTEAGGVSQFTIALNSQPTASVTVNFASNDATEGVTNVTSVTFTPANWQTAQTVTVTGQDDFIDDGDVAYRVVFSASTSTDPNYAGIVPAFLSLQNADNDLADPCNPPAGAQMLWQLDVPAGGLNWDTPAQVPYTTNNSVALAGTSYDRVAYCMTLNGASVYAEMDDFTSDNLAQVMMPMDHVWKIGVTNLTIASTSPAVTAVTNATGGRLELWSNCYATGVNGVYDYDDDNNFQTDCYGSFQIHRNTSTVFAFNAWSNGNSATDIGFGNQVGGSGHPDWTFAFNSGNFALRRISAYVIPRPKSCKEILDRNPAAASGIYLVDPDGTGSVPALSVYCDMTSNGGGWTLIGKTAAGNYLGLSNTQYTDLIANPVAHVNPTLLQIGTPPNAGEIAFYDRATTNSLYHDAGGRVVRVQMTNNAMNAAANGTVFQQRVNAPGNWDFWGALRNSRLWNRDGSVNGASINFVGTDVLVTGNPAQFNPATNTVTHAGSTFYGWWDQAVLTPTSGGPVAVTRHMGLISDGLFQGWHWLLTSNPGDSRWKNDPGFQRSLIWLR